MLRETAERWIKALRSGEYTQGVGRLWQVTTGEAHYCCLGVLMDLEGTDDEKRLHHFKTEGHRTRYYSSQSVGVPNYSFITRVDLTADLMNQVIEMNDANKSFGTIANHLEKELL